jgi:hypothetical protein
MSDPLESYGRQNSSVPSTFEETLRHLRSPQTPGTATNTVASLADRSRLDEHVRAGNILNAMFPDGRVLRSQDEFAAFHLFSRLVTNVARFADTGMAQAEVMEEVAADASALNDLLLESREH